MKTCPTLANLFMAAAFALLLSSNARAAIVFQDSFENDATGYGEPYTNSTPAWNGNVDTGVINTTPTDSNYNKPNTAPTYLTNNSGSTITGEDGVQYVTLYNAGGSSDHDNLGFSYRTPSDQTDTITTVDGTGAGQPGVFAADTTYTLTVLMAAYVDPTLFASYAILDGSTGQTLSSFSYNFGNAADANFHNYGTVTFDTATDPSLAANGDDIQIGLTGAQTSGQPFNRGINFDDVILTASADTPEPASVALMLGGLAALVGLRVRALRS